MIPTRPGHNTTLEEALSEEPQFRAEVRNNPQARKLIEYALKWKAPPEAWAFTQAAC